MKAPGRTHCASPLSSPDLSPPSPADRKFRCRIGKKLVIASRRNKRGASAGPSTPLLRWKFDDDGDLSIAGEDTSARERGSRRAKNEGVVSVSPRKLAAGLWRVAAEVSDGVGGCDGDGRYKCGVFTQLGSEPGIGRARMTFPFYDQGGDYGFKMKGQLRSPLSDFGAENGTISEQFPHFKPYHKFAAEAAIKWDPGYLKTSRKTFGWHSNMKLLGNEGVATVSFISALQRALLHAYTCIRELETEQQSSKQKVEQVLRKLDEDRSLWIRREYQKVHSIVDDLRNELNIEKKNCRRMEMINSKLLHDLTDVKISAKQFFEDYMQEKEARELMEEVCHELVKKIEEEKAEVESIKSKSMKIHEDVEKKRKMLQMAELWHEEQIQIKLVDAKLILEEKYCQINNVIAKFESFLYSRTKTPDEIEISEDDVIGHSVNLSNIQDIEECLPPKSEVMCSTSEVFEKSEVKEKEVDQCLNCNEQSPAILIHTDCHDSCLQENSGLETVIHAEDEISSYITNDSNCTIKGTSRGRIFSKTEREKRQNATEVSPKSQISEICSASANCSKKKLLSVFKLWRSDGEWKTV